MELSPQERSAFLGAVFAVGGAALACFAAHRAGFSNAPRKAPRAAPALDAVSRKGPPGGVARRCSFLPRTLAECGGLRRALLRNKVPRVTAAFWCNKVMCTTVGETAADYLATNAGLGAGHTAAVFASVLFVVAFSYILLLSYWPPLYWLTVILISVVGTLITDTMVDEQGIPTRTSAWIFAVVLATVFAAWWLAERSLSVHFIYTTRREVFYWTAVLFTFALGTAVGDHISETAGLGYAWTLLLFVGAIAAVALAYYASRLRCVPARLRLNTVAAFWAAYILTRPLGAALGDWISQPVEAGGRGFTAGDTSAVFIAAIAAVSAYLTATQADMVDLGVPAAAVPALAVPGQPAAAAAEEPAAEEPEAVIEV